MSIETSWEITHIEAVKKAQNGVAEPKLSPEDAALESFDFESLASLMEDAAEPHVLADFRPQPDKIAIYLGRDLEPAKDSQGKDINGNEHLVYYSKDGKDVIKIDKIRTDEFTQKERLLVHEVVRGLFPEYFPKMEKSFRTEHGSGIVVERIYPDNDKVEKDFTSFEQEFKQATGIPFDGDDTKPTNFMPRKGRSVLIDDVLHTAAELTTGSVLNNIRKHMDKKDFSEDRKEQVTRGLRALQILQERHSPDKSLN